MVEDVKKELKKIQDPQKAKFLVGFFKTGKGQYGEGDIFLGISVPKQRKIAERFSNLKLSEIQILLNSKTHEERLTALIILVNQFKIADEKFRKDIFNFYLKNSKLINNWDLVDLSASNIVGAYLANKDRSILIKLASSNNLWQKRIAIISTLYFIVKLNQSEWTLKIAEILVNDKHDLIQKAVGWMLREVGKRVSQKDEEEFLKKHYKTMPRTCLRYAIERFDPELRKSYMS